MFAASLFPPSLDEDLVQAELYAAGAEVVRDDLRAEELVAYIGPVSPQRLGPSLLAGGVLQRPDHHARERQGDVADPEVDQANAGVRVAMSLGSPLDLGEEVARPQVEERLVDPGHVSPPSPGARAFYSIAARGATGFTHCFRASRC